MANKEIVSLTAAAALAAADLLIASQGGNSRKVTAAQIRALCGYAEPPFVATRWYALMRSAAASGGISQNTISLAPFIITKTMTISDLGCRVTTAQAAQNFQLAIYASDATTGYPTGAALAVTGDITTAATGVITADITGANVTLQPGLYWAAINQSGATAAFQVIGATALSGPLIGSTTPSIVSTASATAYFSLTFAQTYNTWPDLTAQTFGESPSTAAPTGPFLLAKAA